MLRKIPIIAAIGLCLFIVTQYALGADGPTSQLKQAEELTKNKQYEQAEQIYLAIAQQDIPEAFTAQKSLTLLYITTNKIPEADAAYQQLISRFPQHEVIAEALWKIGIAYNQAAKSDKAIEVHQYNVEHFPDDVNAVFSQVEIVKSYLGKGDVSAAAASVSNFLTVFSGQPTLPKGIYHVAKGDMTNLRNVIGPLSFINTMLTISLTTHTRSGRRRRLCFHMFVMGRMPKPLQRLISFLPYLLTSPPCLMRFTRWPEGMTRQERLKRR